MKTCSKCGQTYALDHFRRDAKGVQGVGASCKACRSAQDAGYRSRNRDKRNAALRAAYAADRAKGRAERRDYYAANPHLWWAKHYRQRAFRYGFLPIVADFTRADVIGRYGDSCHYCGRGAFEELDHFVPVIQGGPHTLENVRPSCSDCNQQKGAALVRGESA